MVDENSFEKHVGDFLRIKRRQKFKIIEDIADAASMSPAHLGKLERGEPSPYLYTIYRLWEALDFDAEEMFNHIKDQSKR